MRTCIMNGTIRTRVTRLCQHLSGGLAAGLVTLLLFTGIQPQVLAAGNTLQDVNVASLPGDRIQIRLTLSGQAEKPLSFTIDDPARIAMDFADTTSALPKKSQTIGVGIARSINAVEAKGRTRVVLNLVRMVPYDIGVEGNDVVVTLGGTGGIAGTSAAPAPTAAGPSATGGTIENVDFRRGEQGEGRVIITMSDPSTMVDMRKEAGNIVVEFVNSTLPEALERRLDVVDFATPVKTVDTYAQATGVRMVIEPLIADYEHLAYQSDNVFTIDVKPVSKEEQARRKKLKFGYVGEKLSLNFQNIEVRSVLQLLADFAGFNLVTSDTVTGNVTLRLKNVPWDQALDIILKTKGLSQRKMGNVVLIAPTEEIAAREKLELESQKQIEELAPLHSEYLQVNYAKAADLADLLKAEENSLLSPRGNVSIDERTNTLLVQDTADKLAEIRQLIETLDIPVRQVLIESRIVIANQDFSKDLGVRFGYSNNSDNIRSGDFGATIGGVNEGSTNFGNITAYEVPADSDNEGLIVNLPVTGAAGALGLAIGKIGNYLLQLELSALQLEGRGEVISNPRVITADQKEAIIEQGTEIPYLQASSSGAATITFKKAVLSLKVTPQITPDRNVNMDLTVTQDSVGQFISLLGSSVPSIDTQEVSTQVLVENGETVVLGGIYKQTTRNDVTRVPFFGDLPYVGFLFRQKSETNDKDELLIFVTPKVLDEKLNLADTRSGK